MRMSLTLVPVGPVTIRSLSFLKNACELFSLRYVSASRPILKPLSTVLPSATAPAAVVGMREPCDIPIRLYTRPKSWSLSYLPTAFVIFPHATHFQLLPDILTFSSHPNRPHFGMSYSSPTTAFWVSRFSSHFLRQLVFFPDFASFRLVNAQQDLPS